MKRIGIYAGSFDPVHAGHLSFALQALREAELDEVYFLPERRPRHKPGVEHFAHRVAMLNRATKPYNRLHVLELEDICFTIDHTLPRLRKRFPGSRLIFLAGSDIVPSLPQWPHAARLLSEAELVIGVRQGYGEGELRAQILSWPVQPKALHIFPSAAADISSGQVREALRGRRYVRGLLTSVACYANRNWLYVSLAKSS